MKYNFFMINDIVDKNRNFVNLVCFLMKYLIEMLFDVYNYFIR